MQADQPLQRRSQILAQPLGLEELPLVELGTVGQGETGQKVGPIEVGGLGQRLETGRANLSRGMAVGLAAGQPLLKLGHIEPDIRLLIQAHTLPVSRQPTLTQPLIEF